MNGKPALSEVIAGVTLLFAYAALADVPAPPVNQSIGVRDVLYANLTEPDCRACHSSGVPNRHHLLYGQPIPPGSHVPYPDTDGNGIPDTTYNCLSCHGPTFVVVKNCVVCHTGSSPHHTTPEAQSGNCKFCHGSVVDNMNDGHYIPTYSPSLVTPTPSGGDGLPANSRGKKAGACNYCHDQDSLVPPVIRNSPDLHHKGFNCSWCHETNPLSFHTIKEDGKMHAPGLKKPFTNGCTDCHGADLRGGVARSCYTCHGKEWDNDSGSGHSPYFSTAGDMRKCEGCHGPVSLHNIQADSNKAPTGTIVVGGENAGYGHVGRDAGPGDSDCWGCHGFAMASAPGSGPVIPTVYNSDLAVITAGKDTTVVLNGAAFTNTIDDTLYEADVEVSGADGFSVTLTPDVITDEGTLAVTIPGNLRPGNYGLRAVKVEFTSNPAVLSVVPSVKIAKATSKKKTVTITGSGFAGHAAGSGTSVTGQVTTGSGKKKTTTTVTGAVVSWKDGKIVADFSTIPSKVTVKSVFGSATSKVTTR
jgi:hypothetical protein